MLDKAQSRPDLLLLLSLVSIILVYPLLDHGELRRLLLGILMFVPIILASVRLSQIKGWVWPSLLLMTSVFVMGVISTVYPQTLWLAIKWGLMTAFFGLTVIGLFSFLKNTRVVNQEHLYTAVSIYLLLGLQWFALYSAIEAVYPGAILHSSARADRQSELLYFSLVTLSTIGYGDVVPVYGEVRMLAALEGVTGVLYIAITVAILVSAYKQQNASH